MDEAPLPRFSEGEVIEWAPPSGGAPDQGTVLAVSPDGRRICVRWESPGGLRAARWGDVTRRHRRPQRPSGWSTRPTGTEPPDAPPTPLRLDAA